MERKSMGSFITALRKANGLTQKDLAEKLNISDKTISRWERDENAPDLSVIPVLAEIFNVTCDELLCGERKIAPAQSEGDSPRKAKQMKRILEESLHKFENHSYIAMTISALGVVGGLLANFGFLEANIGFFVSLIFFVIATVYQCIASHNMTYRMNSDAFEPAQLQPYKMRQFNDTLAEIRTYTQSDWQNGVQRYNHYGNMLNFGYSLAVCMGFVYYFSVRKKYAK